MEIMSGKLKIIGIFLSSRGITLPKIIWLDPNLISTCLFLWHIYIPYFNWKCQFCHGDNDAETENYWNLSKSTGVTLPANYLTRPKFALNLRTMHVTHLYTKCQLKMSIFNGDNERKLKIIGIFLSPRGITLPKKLFDRPQYWTQPAWDIYVTPFNWKCQFVMEIMSGNWKLLEFF